MAPAAASWPFGRHPNVYLYIPNLIGAMTDALAAAALQMHPRATAGAAAAAAHVRVGYVRIALMLGALAFAPSYPELCVAAYFLA